MLAALPGLWKVREVRATEVCVQNLVLCVTFNFDVSHTWKMLLFRWIIIESSCFPDCSIHWELLLIDYDFLIKIKKEKTGLKEGEK